MSTSDTREPRRRSRSRIVGALPINQVVGLVVGIASLVAAIAIALSVQELAGFAQWTVRLLAALGVALACMSLTGFIEIEGKLLPFQIRAGGALAIFVAVVFVPPQLIFPPEKPRSVPKDSAEIAALKAVQLLEAQDWSGLDQLADERCTQGAKFADAPTMAREWPTKIGKPTRRDVGSIMTDFFKTPPQDPVRVIYFDEERPSGKFVSQVSLVASGDKEAPFWALCGIFYAIPQPPNNK